MAEEKLRPDNMPFHCRSPIYMCAACSHALNCNDLLNILRIFKYEEIPPEFDELANFPFLEERSFEIDRRNSLNDFSSDEWLGFTRTVLHDKFPQFAGHELRRKHPGYKSPHMFGLLIGFFTKQGDVVLDPFAGTGTSLVAASLMGRDAIGIEKHMKWIDLYHGICEKTGISPLNMHHGDARDTLDIVGEQSIDFVLADPPDMLDTESWADFPPEEDPPLRDYLSLVFDVLTACFDHLKRKKYLALLAKNHYHKGRYLFMPPYFVAAAEDAGFVLKGEKIWSNPAEKPRPYGYPHSYVPNITHHHILIFQKPG